MPGIAYFYITGDNQMFKVPQPKADGYKPISHLANEDVIIVEIVYTTQNRKPVSTIYVSFSRVTLDNKGVYRVSEEELMDAVNDLDLFSMSALHIAEASGPLVIPKARFIPTNEQKNIVIQYMSKKYPSLYQNVAFIIQEYCEIVANRNEKKRKLFKEAAMLRKGK